MKIARTPIGTIALGLAAGAAGTAVMTALQAAEQRLRGGGAASGPPTTWDEAPAPAQVGHRVAEGVFEHDIPLEEAPVVTNVVHWSYGIAWGAAFAVLQRSFRWPVAAAGAAFGTLVFAGGYTALPAMGIYEPAWKYSPKTLGIDLGRHLVYGSAVALAYRVADRTIGAGEG
jgi:hypothetical protein